VSFIDHRQEKSLGELLIQSGLLDAAKLQRALKEQQRTAEPLGKTLVRLGYVHEDQVLKALKGLLVVVFKLHHEHYAFEALYVQEIIRAVAVNRLPQMPPYIEGLFNHRGRIMPVIHLARRLGRTDARTVEDARIIIVEKASALFGLVVDEVESVMQLPIEQIDNQPTLIHRIDPRFLYGVAKVGQRIISLLNLEPLLGEVQSALPVKESGERP
jgi:purine-binding chemotaxis protein CheW